MLGERSDKFFCSLKDGQPFCWSECISERSTYEGVADLDPRITYAFELQFSLHTFSWQLREFEMLKIARH